MRFLSLFLLFLAGCSSVFFSTTTLATAPVQSGIVTLLSYVDPGTEPHQLWLSYGLTPAPKPTSFGPLRVTWKAPKRLTAMVVLRQGAIVLRTDRMDFNGKDTPLVDQKSGRQLRIGTTHYAWLYQIPSAPAGTTVEIELTGAHVPKLMHSVELYVTD